MEHTVLLSDNDLAACRKWSRLLPNVGYAVRLATSPQEVRARLASGRINLAIIDVRVEDDGLETDLGGLTLAAEHAFGHIPKIVFTSYPLDYQAQRTVGQMAGGEPPAMAAFAYNDERPDVLLTEIRRALEAWPQVSLLSAKMSQHITTACELIRVPARRNYVVTLAVSLFDFGVITAGIILAWPGAVVMGIVASATELLLEAFGHPFFTRLDLANRRKDVYHQELLQTYGIEYLLSVAERLSADQANSFIERLVDSAVGSWYPVKQSKPSAARRSGKTRPT